MVKLKNKVSSEILKIKINKLFLKFERKTIEN